MNQGLFGALVCVAHLGIFGFAHSRTTGIVNALHRVNVHFVNPKIISPSSAFRITPNDGQSRYFGEKYKVEKVCTSSGLYLPSSFACSYCCSTIRNSKTTARLLLVRHRWCTTRKGKSCTFTVSFMSVFCCPLANISELFRNCCSASNSLRY